MDPTLLRKPSPSISTIHRGSNVRLRTPDGRYTSIKPTGLYHDSAYDEALKLWQAGTPGRPRKGHFSGISKKGVRFFDTTSKASKAPLIDTDNVYKPYDAVVRHAIPDGYEYDHVNQKPQYQTPRKFDNQEQELTVQNWGSDAYRKAFGEAKRAGLTTFPWNGTMHEVKLGGGGTKTARVPRGYTGEPGSEYDPDLNSWEYNVVNKLGLSDPFIATPNRQRRHALGYEALPTITGNY